MSEAGSVLCIYSTYLNRKKKTGKGVRDIQFYVRCALSKDVLQNFQDRIWISDKHRDHHDNYIGHKKCYRYFSHRILKAVRLVTVLSGLSPCDADSYFNIFL